MVIQRTAALLTLAGIAADLAAGEAGEGVTEIAPPRGATRVPDVLRQGTFLRPQAVSAVEVSGDGRSIAVSTLAFRHDRNFWLLSSGGEPLWGRHVAPWAPFQVVASPGAFAVGIAHSRVTGPQPVISIFTGEKEPETEIVDSLGALGWIRYGAGDWRTGWMPSLIGDLVARAGDSIVTVRGHDGAVRVDRSGRPEAFPFPYVRPYRMIASRDGTAIASGFIVLDPGGSGEALASVVVELPDRLGRLQRQRALGLPSANRHAAPAPASRSRARLRRIRGSVRARDGSAAPLPRRGLGRPERRCVEGGGP